MQFSPLSRVTISPLVLTILKLSCLRTLSLSICRRLIFYLQQEPWPLLSRTALALSKKSDRNKNMRGRATEDTQDDDVEVAGVVQKSKTSKRRSDGRLEFSTEVEPKSMADIVMEVHVGSIDQ